MQRLQVQRFRGAGHWLRLRGRLRLRRGIGFFMSSLLRRGRMRFPLAMDVWVRWCLGTRSESGFS